MITADCNLDARRHLSPVYMPSYHNPGDGFGGWEAMGRTWLQGLGFDVLDEAPAKPAPWTIAVGSLCWPRPPGRWATLWTAVDACALANPMAQLCRFDECWVATPSQVARLRELGFIGPVAVVRPPLVWRPRVALGAGYLVWVGTGAPRKRREEAERLATEAGIPVRYVNRAERALPREEYDELLAGSLGLIVASESEGWSAPVREAVYMGLPVYGLRDLPEYDGLVTVVADGADLRRKVRP